MIATVFAISALATIPATAATTAAPTQPSTYATNPGFEFDAKKTIADAKKAMLDAKETILDAKKTMLGTDHASGRTFNYPEAAMNSKLRGGSHLATDSSPERRLNSRCKSKDAKWIENSSMELNGPGWYGTVNGGSYHCQLSLAGGRYKYRVDCVKTGGSNTDFFFNDGDDRYGLYMKTNGNHVVHYNGKAPIIAVGVCSDATVSITGRKLASWTRHSIPNSSMELNGAGWHGKVNGGNYHCRLVKSKSWIYDYKVDCTKSGGHGTDFQFNDGGDTYALGMTTNTHHTVSYKGNPRIVAISYSDGTPCSVLKPCVS
jgi:hypothetical protein